jgi:hypothetical protein
MGISITANLPSRQILTVPFPRAGQGVPIPKPIHPVGARHRGMNDFELSRALLPRCLAPTHPPIHSIQNSKPTHPSTQALCQRQANANGQATPFLNAVRLYTPSYPSTLTPIHPHTHPPLTHLPLKLLVVKIGIAIALSQQFLMGARFHNAALIHDQNPIGPPNRGEAVGNDEGGAIAHQPL